jgi:uncharacterized membrane protein
MPLAFTQWLARFLTDWFDSPWYLLLLALLPLVWYVSHGSLSGLGTWRRWGAITLRSLVLVLLVLAIADMQYRQKSDRVMVLYLLDQSLSIPQSHREAMREFVNEAVNKHLQSEKGDRVGVIAFGREAEVERVPRDFFDDLRDIETTPDPQFTNLAGALQRARSLYPPGFAKRIVLVTDGNENLGDALTEARGLADAGVSIDVLPVSLPLKSDVSVEKLTLPADVRQGQPYEMRIVLNNDAAEGAAPLPGTVRVIRKAGEREEILAESPVELEAGKTVLTVKETIERPDFYTYEARFTPADPTADATARNNVGTAFTHVRGKGHVLLIEDWSDRGQFDYLVDRLRSSGLEVTVQPSNQLFTSLPELQRYDTVVLANVPRSSGEDADDVSSFSDAQIRMLVRNTEELGCGLVMLGGTNSFGAGGWANTELEKAMPVDFQIKNTKVVPVGALALMMHASEMARGNYWQKKISIEAIKTLGDRDYCGMIQWNMTDQWLWGQSKGGMIPVGPQRNMMMAQIDRMQVGDMPSFEPAMRQVAKSFANLATGPVPPATKHMIIISDGDPTPPSRAVLDSYKKMQVTITTVAVGAHGTVGHSTMRNIAETTGGKYYVVNNANALPRIYQRETRRVARPLVKDLTPPRAPIVQPGHEILTGIDIDGIPPVGGLVLTSKKESSLVETVMRSPDPPVEDNSTLLAAWPYGLGKAVAFTTDAGKQWTPLWTEWNQYDQFFSQMIRWSMRPTGDTGNFSVATDVKDGKTRVVIDALDKNEDFVNVAAINGSVVGPDMKSIPLAIQQVAPGRYIGEFESMDPGSYMISLLPGGDQGMIRTGVNVGYSEEFRDRETNLPLLESLAKLQPAGGKPGVVVGSETATMLSQNVNQVVNLLGPNPYRRDLPPAVASQSIWPYLVLLAAIVFFTDVLVRRVQMGFEWLERGWDWVAVNVFGRRAMEAAPATLSRLQSRKAEVQQQFEAQRAATRFEAASDAEPATGEPSPLASLDQPTRPATAAPQGTGGLKQEAAEQESYTSRLLKAKKDVWKDK